LQINYFDAIFAKTRAMKKHNGMRPHDLAVLLKVALREDSEWKMKDLARELFISPSEISESINRSVIAGLMSPDKKHVRRLSLLEFLRYGFPFVFPQRPAGIAAGIETAHSAMPLKERIVSNSPVVWPSEKGKVRGMAIEPLYPKLPEACLKDSSFFELMALVESLRIGKARERILAFEMLQARLGNGKQITAPI
jgi:hypothetical protein